MLKKILIGLVVLIVLAVAAVLVGPSLIDWNNYKPEIAAAVKKATGRDIAIDGDVTVSVLPSPEASVAGVRFANAAGGSVPDMASFETLKVRVALAPLLSGDIKVESIVLVKPSIVLESYADGTANWEIVSAEAEAGGDGAEPGSARAVSLDEVIIEDGRIEYRDAEGSATVVEDIDATLSARSLAGPFAGSGQATARGVRAAFEASTGPLAEQGETAVSLTLRLPDTDTRVTFAGQLDQSGEAMKLTGHLSAAAAGLGAALDALAADAAAGAALPLDGPLSFESDVVANPAALELSRSTLQIGDTTAKGSATVETGGAAGAPTRIAATLAVNRLDLDALTGGGAAADGAAPDGPAANAPLALDLPQGIEIGVDLGVETLAWRNGVISKAHILGKLDNGAFNLTGLTALLPGNTAVDLSGAVTAPEGAPRFAGDLSATSDNLRVLLEWLQVALPAIPSDRLHKAAISTKVTATADTFELSALDLTLDNTKATGGLSVALPGAARSAPAFGIGLSIDRINLDGYMPPASAEASTPAPPEADGAGLPLAGLAPLAGIGANLQLKIASLTYNSQTIQNLVLDGGIADGTLTLKELSIGDFAGGSGTLSGVLSDLAGTPRFDTKIDLAAKDAARALRFAGVTVPAAADLGSMKLGGTLSGGAADVAYNLAFSIAGIGAEGKAEGTASGLTRSVPRIDTTFGVSAKNAGPLLEIAGLGNGGAAELGAMSLSGSATSGADEVAYDISLLLPDIGGAAKLKGTLKGLEGTPVVDTALDLSAKQPAALLALAGVDTAGVDKLGALKVAGTLSGNAEAMKLDLGLEALGGTAKVVGDVGLPPAGSEGAAQVDIAVEATHPELRDLIAAVAPDAKPAQKIGAFTLSTRAKSEGTAIALNDLKLAAGPTRIAGTATIDTGGLRPRINADLKANTIPVAAFAPAAGASSGSGNGGGRWSTEPLDMSLLTGLDGDIALAADSVQLESSRIDNFVARMRLQDGVLTITQLNGNTQGGAIDVTGEVRGRGVPSFSANVVATKLEIAEIAGGGAMGAHGPLSINGTFSSSGVSMAEIVDALSGRAAVDGNVSVLGETGTAVGSGLLAGLGLQVGELRGVTDIVGGVLVSLFGKTSDISGNYVIERGVLRTEDTSADNALARALARGRVNLSAWTLDMLTDVFRGSDNPWLTLGLTGSIDSPNVKLAGLAFSPENMTADVLKLLQSGGAGASGLVDSVVPGLLGSLPGLGDAGALLPEGIVPEGIVPEGIVPESPLGAVQDAVGGLLGGGQQEEAPAPEQPAAEEKPKPAPQNIIEEVLPGLGDLFGN